MKKIDKNFYQRALGFCCGCAALALLGGGAQAQMVNYGEQLGA